ncbi:phenylacetate--CoA ligase family protein [Desulfohalobium retbaense]|uniref:Coenzyme F390 synthetase-like protein n=1 Tax=Desulfohalobium retbaense (strain ATCC 49708 / DSM 5692 / JCM 16813 / HR100) TaxID=485915 RepID=C8X062_DESRD|nr:phenylacetate--CoA ligase family protein [Desulfohalobium retbaense]ACV67687.1 Coenzyme F390 synthetase-like protein [Desulfohalobium retbaense DSM 5692]
MKNKIDIESIYLKLPIFLQNILVSIEGKRIQRRRYSRHFYNIFNEVIDRFCDLDMAFQGDYQKKRLRDFLQKARLSPFWYKRFLDYEVDPDAEDVFQELRKLPVLSKDEVKDHAHDIDISAQLDVDFFSCHTSGTTGSGLVFPVSKEAEREQWATWWRYRLWHGIKFDTLCGYFGGRSLVSLSQQKPPYWRVNRPGRQIMFSAYHLSDKTAPDYIAALNRYRVPWIHGYPSTIALLAGLKRDLGLPDIPSLQVATIGAESLLSQQRELIENVLKVPVREHYGLAEGVANISECPNGRLHVDEDFAYVEFLPVNRDGTLFKIVGTNWSNPVFPLFRYDTGDIATIEDNECSCEKEGRVVKCIDGRKEDYVSLPSGAKVGRLDHIFKDMININAAQIYQPNVEDIVIRVVPGKNFNRKRDEKDILSETRKRLGNEISISFEYVSELPKTKSGKLRFVVSDVQENKIAV